MIPGADLTAIAESITCSGAADLAVLLARAAPEGPAPDLVLVQSGLALADVEFSSALQRIAATRTEVAS